MSHKFLLLYGTTDGQSKSIAEIILDRCEDTNLEPNLYCMDQVGKKFDLKRETCVVFVCSTTGDGDPPENAQKLVRQLKSKSLPSDYLSHLNFALLGLGDTNYSTFCGGPKQLDKALRSLGAKEICPSGWADDAVGLEIVVDPWIDDLFPALEQFLNRPFDSNSNATNSVPDSSPLPISQNTCHPILNDDMEPISKSSSNYNPDLDITLTNALNSLNFCQPERTELLGSDNSLLANVELSVPQVPPPFLKVDFGPDILHRMSEHCLASTDLPLNKGPITQVKLTSLKKLTTEAAGKVSYKAIFDYGSNALPLKAGDSIGLLCQNDPLEVDALLKRLNICDSDAKFRRINLSVLPETAKKRAAVPDHLTCCNHNPVTIYQVFLDCVDIRQVASKALLRMLAEYCSMDKEKRCLLELSSRQGQTLFTRYTREAQLSLLDLLQWLPSLQPPVSRLLELLPRLQARPYSVSNLPKSNLFSIVFNLVEIPQSDLRLYPRKGVATGGLQRLWESHQTSEDTAQPDCFVYLRKNISLFSPPKDSSLPLILIGPGTGCAPFIGFLETREALMKDEPDGSFGEIWLFHGCRYRDKDELFKEELSHFLSGNVLHHLCVCYSRERSGDTLCAPGATYVQHCVEHHAAQVTQLIVGKQAHIYVCGDAKGMAKDVNATFVDILTGYDGMSREQANDLVIKLRVEKRYVEDVWT